MARETFLAFSPPSIGEEEIAEVVEALRTGWITTGPKARLFEEEFRQAVGADDVLAVSSATAAMHLALLVLGVGPGHAVVCTPLTFCSTLHVIEHIGARPVLADVDPATLNIDPVEVERVVHQGAPDDLSFGAILPVHLHGLPADLANIDQVANASGLAVVEDAAHALPARSGDSLIGSPRASLNTPNLVAFSFYATKNVTSAEGGMLTGPAELIKEARTWSLHGMSYDAHRRYTSEGSWQYEVLMAGFKYNLSDIHAGIGRAQLRKLPAMQARRRTVVERYNAAFAGVEELEPPALGREGEHAWHIYALRLHLDRLSIGRAAFIEDLRARNIGASVHFIPLHIQPFYRDRYGYKPEDFPVALREYERMISLPLNPSMSDQDADDVIEAVLAIVDRNRR